MIGSDFPSDVPSPSKRVVRTFTISGRHPRKIDRRLTARNKTSLRYPVYFYRQRQKRAVFFFFTINQQEHLSSEQKREMRDVKSASAADGSPESQKQVRVAVTHLLLLTEMVPVSQLSHSTFTVSSPMSQLSIIVGTVEVLRILMANILHCLRATGIQDNRMG